MQNNSPFLKDFFNTLNKEKLDYCVLRNYEYLPDSLNGSDLDILVSKCDIDRFYVLLDKILASNNGKIIIKYGKLTPRICIAGIENHKAYGLQLDVHEGILPYKNFNMFPVELILHRSIKHNGIVVANDKDAYILAFLKEILNNQTCKNEYFLKAKEVWVNNDIYKTDLKKIYDDLFVDKLNSLMQNSYSEKEIIQLSQLGRKELTQGLNKKIIIFSSFINKLYRFRKPPGFTVAIMGTDGAGKTTIINKITAPLNEAVHNALFYEHMRPNLIPNIAQLLGKEKMEKVVVNPHASKPSGFIVSLFRLFYYSFDYIIGYSLKVYPIMVKKSSIWIFDRYFYDYYIDQKRARIQLPLWIIKSMNILIPSPNLVLCFGANPKVIFDRKPELPYEEVCRQVDKLKEFCNMDEKYVWVDTEQSIEKTVEEAFNIIIIAMSSRYE